MIVIYTPKVTNRIKYTIDFVFHQYFGIDYELTDKAHFTILPENFYIHYSNQKTGNGFSVFQDVLLLQENIEPQKIFISHDNNLPVFFQTTDHYNLKFDIFSAIFYLISRYEEYLPHEQDNHGRYKSSNSILSNPSFNFSPIVEYWLDFFKQEMLKFNSNLFFKKHEFEYLPTFDIDNAFQFLGRNWLKNPPNILLSECRNVLLKKKKDAYDNLDFILDELIRNKQTSVFFFLMNDDGKENSNVSPDSELLHAQIAAIFKEHMNIGIHPSYLSVENNITEKEKSKLESIKHSAITISRQHFLKINFPGYFRKLIAAGIETDYSLAYADVPGFRAGCSRAFLFFDLEKNESTSLLLQPACIMDATFEYYQSQKNNNFKEEFLTIFNQLKKINGKLVPIFHNDLFAEDSYRNVFTFINHHIKTNEHEE